MPDSGVVMTSVDDTLAALLAVMTRWPGGVRPLT
jgi:hypothetical protein